MLEEAIKQINNLKGYWPLTLRQIYYRLVSELVIENDIRQYQKLSRVLVKGRLDEEVPWESMEDRSRNFEGNYGLKNKGEFITIETELFLTNYQRDLMQSQPIMIEVWIEKDALSSIFERVVRPFCIPLVTARGFASMSFKYDCYKRILRDEVGRPCHILYFGDFDPSGYEMLPALLKTLQEDLGLGPYVTGEHVALSPKQVSQYQLPHDPSALKKGDSRYKKFTAKYGMRAVELDALLPSTLEDIVCKRIKEVIDMTAFADEIRKFESEKKALERHKDKVKKLLSSK